MGTEEPGIPPDGEGPQRPVVLDPFFMDTQEVSNLQFQAFVSATGYVTEVNHHQGCSVGWWWCRVVLT